MLTYNNRLRPLVLPEYGRNIQNMVDHCLTIDDRAERTRCAETIVDTMQTLFPATGDHADYRRKLWDHVMIMSDFKLDVDMPYEHVDPTVFADKPDPVPPARPGTAPYKYYGSHIPALIEEALTMENGEERDALIYFIANQMKKVLAAELADGVDDARVFADLRSMSHGILALEPEMMELQDYKIAPAPGKKKKKK